jgi:cell division inhibitor SulA/protein ImuA
MSLLKGTGLAQLLEHPAIWRGRSAARIDTLSTGFRALDEGLPGGGWPRAGLTEILAPRHGVGELRLLLPLLARLAAVSPPRWVVWIAPPFEPYAPALAAHGVCVERQLVVRTETPLWAMEQALDSGACELALAWVRRAQPRSLRRLQLAAGRGRTPGFLFRALTSARESSPAELRVLYEPGDAGATLRLLKSRGGARAPIGIRWEDGDGAA